MGHPSVVVMQALRGQECPRYTPLQRGCRQVRIAGRPQHLVVVAESTVGPCDSPLHCKSKRGDLLDRLLKWSAALERLNVFRLPALGSLGDLELHGLAFLQAPEASRLDGGEMHENVFAILTANKAVALGVIEPLYCSLFHLFILLFLFVVTLERFGRNLCR